MKRTSYKIIFGLIKKILIGLLTDIDGSNNKKYVSLSNQKCMIQPTIINLKSRISLIFICD